MRLILFATLTLLLAGCDSVDPINNNNLGQDGGAINYDGTWNVNVAISSCYMFTHSGTVTVTNGAFSGDLFAYCAEATGGATRLDTGAGCGSDIREKVSIDGTMASGQIDGNLTLTGGACNGANGIAGTLTSPTAGSSPDFWGDITFTKI